MQVNTTDMQLSNVVGGRQITELPTIGNSETIVTRASCHFVVHLKRGFEQLQLRSGLVLVATLCSHWRIPDALLSCHRYGEILPPVQSNLATCQIQRSAAARRFRSEQTGSKVRIVRHPTRIGSGDPTNSAVSRGQVVSITEGRRAAPSDQSVGRSAAGSRKDLF